jgi:hypothetical protein
LKQLMLLSGVLLGSLLGVTPARAYTMAQQCVIANTLCFPLRASASGMTPERRIDQVNDRLAFILGYEVLQPENIRTRPTTGGEVEIWVGRSLLATVTWADARANGTPSPQAVARIWASNLRGALPQARP